MAYTIKKCIIFSVNLLWLWAVYDKIMNKIYSVLLLFLLSVDTAYLQLTCPLVFNEGSNVITCSVNQTRFNSACPRPFIYIQFIYERPDATLVTECETPNAQISNTCPSASSKGVHSNSTCLCSQRNGNMVTYELHFIGSRAQHEGITLRCAICLPQNDVDQIISPSCSNIQFG